MNIVEMIPHQLYIGGKIKNSDLEFIYNHITAIINLRTEPDLLPFNFNQIVMVWTPLTISSTPGVNWTIKMTKLISRLIDSKHIVFLHDTIGIQRLGFVITAFYMYRFNLTRDQALALIRQKKSNINPPENYMNLLLEFEATLQRS
ncbi:dual specificity protein phosphatase family protein [Priestia megaterium]|uniref:dual specificity protein phosphatase family protein n=1 Tax=Priestia megaterium TaxID=1404 RepID=UPI00215E5300|nr:dual specificity protein phosphatase family protein [Priestia megaterium]MCR8927472.1 dual specificity protein phosphatase family protein [Priestia megaterium]